MFHSVTFEMSLKPFKSLEDSYIDGVLRKMFKQWYSLAKDANMVSVLLWCSDGSEILEYKGDLDEPMEWARYIGGAQQIRPWNKEKDPDMLSLHTRPYLYIDNPVEFTYGDLKRVVSAIKRVGREVLGDDKIIRVGETFDPGPEFAVSDFKYKRHREICVKTSVGEGKMVCCYSTLNADPQSYAAFPNGIEEGTPLGTFFGRQVDVFLKDMGFDYIWFSNGFGFGADTWGTRGAIFDGKAFYAGKIDEVRDNILKFWKLFRQACPDIPVEVRGTNLSVGIDRSTDGTPTSEIYNGGFGILPPPNSPWAALDGDFGLELIGYMSRIAGVPSDDYLFRYYVHDPWWVNSPWIDRYEASPHDIYLPMAVSRINERGEIKTPNYLNFLSVDNSYGELPDRCPNEVIPHILTADAHRPDNVSPVVMIYPFDEYTVLKDEQSLKEMFFADWFMRGAINNGFPVSSVVSTSNFILSLASKPALYDGSVLVSAIPQAGSEFEKVIIQKIKSGAKVIFFGPVSRASDELLELLNLKVVSAVSGELPIDYCNHLDQFAHSGYKKIINHRELLCGGGIDTMLKQERADTEVLATVGEGEDLRVAALCRKADDWNGGALIWLRGTNSSGYIDAEKKPFTEEALLLKPDNPNEYFNGEILMRFALEHFGISIGIKRNNPAVKSPVLMVHRNNNAFYFSGYVPDTTTEIKLKFPLGAPLLMGWETVLQDGYSAYRMPRAFHCESRVFVENQQGGGVVSYREIPSISFQMRRRLEVTGLNGATVRIFPEADCEGTMTVLLNSTHPHFVGEPFEGEWKQSPYGPYFEARNVTGKLTLSMPRKI